MPENPYSPPPESIEGPTMEGLCCPYCGETFRLTWRRYLRHPAGKQTCPCCGRRSKLRGSWATQILVGSASLFAGLGAYAVASVSLAMGVITFGALIGLILAVDRWNDERRELRPLEN